MPSTEAVFCEKLSATFKALGLDSLLTEERAVAFYRLFHLLVEENEKYNLTALTAEDDVILLHFADSVMGASLIPAGASLIDVGCGAGFPTLPLAIVRPDVRITAADATAKKTAFVAAAAERLGLANVTTLTGRAEVLARSSYREAFDMATARAVAALPVLLELCTPFLRKGGLFLALKGRSAMEELHASHHAMGELKCKVRFTREYEIGEGDAAQKRGILLLEKAAPTPETYPRAYARIKSRPL